MSTRDSIEPLDGSESANEALTRLVDEHGGRIHQLGLRFCGDAEQARDLVQETFLQAYRSWSDFEGRSQVGTWLYTIAANVCRRFHRKREGEPQEFESLDASLPFGESTLAVVPSQGEGPLDASLRSELRQRIEAAISYLPESFRMPFVLKEMAGLDLREIAETLGQKPETIKTRIHRARLKVRSALEDSLPRREVPPPIFSRQVCGDLLNAKQESIDRGVSFEFPNHVICEHCSEVFATLDLTSDLCAQIGAGPLPADLRKQISDSLEQVDP